MEKFIISVKRGKTKYYKGTVFSDPEYYGPRKNEWILKFKNEWTENISEARVYLYNTMAYMDMRRFDLDKKSKIVKYTEEN